MGEQDGKAIANLTFHVNDLKLLGKSISHTERVADNAVVTAGSDNTDDDLPF